MTNKWFMAMFKDGSVLSVPVTVLYSNFDAETTKLMIRSKVRFENGLKPMSHYRIFLFSMSNTI